MEFNDRLLKTTKNKVSQALTALEKDSSTIRTGKASSGLVENILVPCYGASSRLRDIAGITTPETRLIAIQPWDKSLLQNIEKALHTSDLGIIPVNDGQFIRITIPELSEERRRELVKQLKKRAEQAKIEIRNYRRAANDEAKKAKKNADITEDTLESALQDVQQLINQYLEKIDGVAKKKENDILQV